ncbi:hypothetical protein [Oryza sativa Japonica Group]|uniref:Uncharacterized protein n=1 Tax=Oryza sativa subsp. japonica TaxID=39947 RepID=Q5JJW3_ORYSJ|nr:hypothetical protein [Oryza sativa Japonica Group]BAD88244.1 hypothetical protein [Oryza sativa Japonica Group]
MFPEGDLRPVPLRQACPAQRQHHEEEAVAFGRYLCGEHVLHREDDVGEFIFA